jgi:uncharacterized phiE125 gp8 family phage protein
MRTELVTPPTEEPVTLAQAKVHLRLGTDPLPEDDLNSEWITAARERCETEISRSFVTQTRDLFLDAFPFGGGFYLRQIRELGPGVPNWMPSSQVVKIPYPPLQSVTFLKYLDIDGNIQTLNTSQYRVLTSTNAPGKIEPNWGVSWPITQPVSDTVQVRYVCGYGAAAVVPASIKGAIKLLVGHKWENREATLVGTNAIELPRGVRDTLQPCAWGRYS